MDRSQINAQPSIRMGEMSVARDGETLRTLLGSCLGLALYDDKQRIGGLAHIVLPKSQGKHDVPGKFVDTAIPALLDQMQSLARSELQPMATIAGGASMFTKTVAAGIGQQNIQRCEKILTELGIPIADRHCGGRQGRRMSLDTGNGNVVIELVGQPPVQLDRDPRSLN